MKPLSAHMIEPRQTNTFSSELHHFWRQQVFSLVGKTKVVDLIFYVLSTISIIQCVSRHRAPGTGLL